MLYYRDPDGKPDYRRGTPWAWTCNDEDGLVIKISPIERRVITVPVRAPGVVQADEQKHAVAALRFDAYIEANKSNKASPGR